MSDDEPVRLRVDSILAPEWRLREERQPFNAWLAQERNELRAEREGDLRLPLILEPRTGRTESDA